MPLDPFLEAEIKALRTLIIDAFNFQKNIHLPEDQYTYRFIHTREDYRLGLLLERNLSFGKNSVLKTFINFKSIAYPTIPEYRVEKFPDVIEGSDDYQVGFMMVPYKDYPVLSQEGRLKVFDYDYPQYPTITSFTLVDDEGEISASVSWEQTGQEPTSYHIYVSETPVFPSTPTISGIGSEVREYDLPIPEGFTEGELYVKLELVFGDDIISVIEVAQLGDLPVDPPPAEVYKIVSVSPNTGLWSNGPDFSSLLNNEYTTEEELRAAVLALVPVGQPTGHTGGSFAGNWAGTLTMLMDGFLDNAGNSEELYAGFGYDFANRASNVGFVGGRTLSTSFGEVNTSVDIVGLTIHYTPNVYVTGPFPVANNVILTSFTAEPGQVSGDLPVTLTWDQEGEDPLYYNVYFSKGSVYTYVATPDYTNISGQLRTVELLATELDSFIGSTAYVSVKLEAVYANGNIATNGFTYMEYQFSRFIDLRIETIIHSSAAKDAEGDNEYYGAFSNQSLLQRTAIADPTGQTPIPIWQGDELRFNVYGILPGGVEEFIPNPGINASGNWFSGITSTVPIPEDSEVFPFVRKANVSAYVFSDPTSSDLFNLPAPIAFNVEGRIVNRTFFVRAAGIEVISDRPLITDQEPYSYITLDDGQSTQLSLRVTIYPERTSFVLPGSFVQAWTSDEFGVYSISPTGVLTSNNGVGPQGPDFITFVENEATSKFSWHVKNSLIVKWGPDGI